VVAEVDVALPGVKGLLADLVQRQHRLYVAGTVAQRGEAELPAVALEHDAAGYGDLIPSGRVSRELGVLRPQLTDGRTA
jgi:hypothetical protein